MPLTPDFTKRVIKAFALQSIRIRTLEHIVKECMLQESSDSYTIISEESFEKYFEKDRQIIDDLLEGRRFLSDEEAIDMLEAMFAHDDKPPPEKPE